MQNRFKFRYFDCGAIYDVFAVDFMNKTAQLVSLDRKETLMKRIDTDKLIQYTGLKDENGTLIYEGDIVQILGDEIPFVIEFEQDRAMFVIHSKIDRVCCNFDNYSGDDLYVIGNIYKNPELLEEE